MSTPDHPDAPPYIETIKSSLEMMRQPMSLLINDLSIGISWHIDCNQIDLEHCHPMSEDKDATITVLQLLSRYLLDHPLASDTPDGIASWWLRLDWATHASAIESALRRLIDLGSIEEIGGPDGRVRYRRVPGALADAALADLAAPGWLQPGGNGSSTH